MELTRARWLLASLFICAAACSSPTEPAPAGYAGEWTGTTSHGTAVSFSVSGNDVTSFTVAFNAPPACSGIETMTGPKQIVTDTSNKSGFVISKVFGNFEWGVAAAGEFSVDRRSASGQVITPHHPACGTSMLNWTAKRR